MRPTRQGDGAVAPATSRIRTDLAPDDVAPPEPGPRALRRDALSTAAVLGSANPHTAIELMFDLR